MFAPSTPPCFAQSEDIRSVHWAYSAFFGSGYYKLGDSPGVTVLRANLRRDIADPSYEAGRRKAGILLRVPITVGHQGRFAGAEDIAEASLDTLSIVPGVELPITIGERWTIKPQVSLGYGRAEGGNDSAWIYRAGLSSRYTFESRRFQWSLVNELAVIGYADSNSGSQQSMPLTLGIEASIPLRSRKIDDHPVTLHWHASQTHYLGKLEIFEDYGKPFLELDREWEFGAAFGKGDEPLRLWKFSWDRVGIALRVDSDGDLAGMRLNFQSLFDR
ncbi:MAG TPA: hypothetical protein VKQ06_08260 [Gammaproteobacteria bacterium]|nr:hypothetical protein [Gammaproteobacteria bacterium]